MTELPKVSSWRHASRGFSVVELVLTIAIIGALALIAVPRYASSEERYRAESAANRVIADLLAAQETAKATSSDQRVRFSIGGSKYYLSFTRSATVSGLAVGSVANAESVEVDLAAEPYRAKVVGASINGYAGIVFDPYGMPSGGGTILLRVGSLAARVVVDPANGLATGDVMSWSSIPMPTRTDATTAQPMAADATYRAIKEAAAMSVQGAN